MATIYELKSAFQSLLRPLSERLVQRGATPNQITLTALGLSVLYGLAIGLFPFKPLLLLLPIILLVRMALNALDGMIAREHNMRSVLGQFYNELGDVLSDGALYLPLALIDGVSGVLVVLSVVLASGAELVGVVGLSAGGTRRYDGPMGKSDRAFAFGVIALLLWFDTPLPIVNLFIGVIAALTALTINNRMRASLKELGEIQ